MNLTFFKISIIFLLIGASQMSYAEVKSIQCTYLAEAWKLEDISEYANCPTTIGQPWRWDTYTFDINSDSKTVPVEVKLKFCFGKEYL